MDQNFYYHKVQFIRLTNKKTIYQDLQYLLNHLYFKKGTDFERIKKHVHIYFPSCSPDDWIIDLHFCESTIRGHVPTPSHSFGSPTASRDGRASVDEPNRSRLLRGVGWHDVQRELSGGRSEAVDGKSIQRSSTSTPAASKCEWLLSIKVSNLGFH